MNRINQKTTTDWNTFKACGVIEGDWTNYVHPRNIMMIEAWAYLIRENVAWQLRNWYAEEADRYIAKGLIDYNGKIYWEKIQKNIDKENEKYNIKSTKKTDDENT